jgi:pyruvate/2-oxoglutarate dehydrogenase complex dihydrolipoamide dehydrogenase (E3) component
LTAGSLAGELITHFTMAIQAGVGAEAMSKLIIPYPTHAEALKYHFRVISIQTGTLT